MKTKGRRMQAREKISFRQCTDSELETFNYANFVDPSLADQITHRCYSGPQSNRRVVPHVYASQTGSRVLHFSGTAKDKAYNEGKEEQLHVTPQQAMSLHTPPKRAKYLQPCLVDNGHEYAGFSNKCLQASVQSLLSGRDAARARAMLSKLCDNHVPSGANAGVLGHNNFLPCSMFWNISKSTSRWFPQTRDSL